VASRRAESGPGCRTIYGYCVTRQHATQVSAMLRVVLRRPRIHATHGPQQYYRDAAISISGPSARFTSHETPADVVRQIRGAAIGSTLLTESVPYITVRIEAPLKEALVHCTTRRVDAHGYS